MFTVRRTWSGSQVGQGTLTDVTTEILPQPRILEWSGLDIDLTKCGLDEIGPIKLTEWSLTYTHAEIVGPKLNKNEQWMIKITEAHGQLNPDRFFLHDRPPYVDRMKDMGWVCWLRSVDV